MSFYPDPIGGSRPRPSRVAAAEANFSTQAGDTDRWAGAGGGPGRNDKLRAAEVGLVNKRAQMKATLTGLLSAFAVGLGARKTRKVSPNASVVLGIAAGSFIAYLQVRTELARGMTALAYSHEMRTGKNPFGPTSLDDPELLRDDKWDEN